MDTIITIIKTAITDNDFFSGGFILMGLGAISATIWRVFPKIYNVFKRRYTITIEIRDSEILSILNRWIALQQYGQICKVLSVGISRNESDSVPAVKSSQAVPIFSPGRGSHFFKYKNTWVWLSKETEDSNFGDGISLKKEYIALKSFGRNSEKLKALIKEAFDFVYKEDNTTIDLRCNSAWDWGTSTKIMKRPISSLVFNNHEGDSLVKDIKWFYNNRDWYVRMGIPYRRGYMLYGPPGTGKTSLATSLASEMNLNIYLLNLSSKDFDDMKLSQLLTQILPNSILLIEDIDAYFHGRERKESLRNQITFSGILNALDGVSSDQGRVVIITTNCPDNLDEALIRPGRIDVKIELGRATKQQAKSLYLKFFPDNTTQAECIYNHYVDYSKSPAELQETLLSNYTDPNQALNNILGEGTLPSIGECDSIICPMQDLSYQKIL